MYLHLLVETFHNGRNFERKRYLMDSNELALTGQVALVTGASSGLGRATALALAQAGADLVLLARSADDLQRVVTELTPSGSRVVAFPGDVAHEDDIVNAVTHAIETFGHIDILVNAAGIDVPGPIVQLATSDWDYVLDGNPLGSVVIDPAHGIGTGTPTCHQSVTPSRGRVPYRLDSNCASRTGPQRGHHQPARRGRLAVASEVLSAFPWASDKGW